jgi:hypothetical protein
MTEKEYCDVSDLGMLRNIKSNVENLNCFKDPNKTRRMSISQNLQLMIENLYRDINLDDEVKE